MEVILLRHGQTAGNLTGRYIGSTDEPLAEAGIRELKKIGVFAEVSRVYVSPMKRAVETASLLFPHATMALCQDLREMDFGDFEGRSAKEMVNDPAYCEWVNSGCTSPCPHGESRDTFTERTCAAFDMVVRESIMQKEQRLIVAAHGGSIMAIMSRYAKPGRPYFEWHVKNCCGYRARLDERTWESAPLLWGYSKLKAFC